MLEGEFMLKEVWLLFPVLINSFELFVHLLKSVICMQE